jgi:hypothetical protein
MCGCVGFDSDGGERNTYDIYLCLRDSGTRRTFPTVRANNFLSAEVSGWIRVGLCGKVEEGAWVTRFG